MKISVVARELGPRALLPIPTLPDIHRPDNEVGVDLNVGGWFWGRM